MAHDAPSAAPSPGPPPSARTLLPLVVPSLVVGAVSALVLLGVSTLADQLENVLWETLPDALGIGHYSTLWMIVMLTATGLAVGIVVHLVYGHAGPDPATTGLVDEPMPPGVVPGLLVVTVLALAGGVSLGPENPITAVNVALAYWLGRKAAPDAPGAIWLPLAAAGTIGALFGTPVAAALILTETLAARPGPGSLWDKLFGPLIAAGMGALITALVAHPTFDLALPAYTGTHWGDLLAALVIAPLAAALGLAAVYAFPYVHAFFRRLGHPVVAITAGGLVLGLLGALGGPLTLFKGLHEVKTLAADPDGWSAGSFALMTVVKLAALLTAAACGFRGGRIFPAVFVGVALGLCAHALVPAVQPSLGVVCGVLGVLLALTRQGWLSLFTAAVLVADPNVLPLLCIAALPAWLLVTGRPQMQLHEDGTPLR
ncbi:ion channel protein [Streptomyces scopuliridis]|uniref:Ion channel protein n=1 Tax=Streptomyces scopuliridis TaxID=452529 RepID=A0ACD4ZKB7_9ACTN|nr:ion channel protein [Streptomyces scopuliridis]WSB98614.1 ion channel protein [Streptomyces scopuliridis]WSC07683.1 ion channel protein [Streptomyces scopuliridis]